jgi:hypothetical protein
MGQRAQSLYDDDDVPHKGMIRIVEYACCINERYEYWKCDRDGTAKRRLKYYIGLNGKFLHFSSEKSVFFFKYIYNI